MKIVCPNCRSIQVAGVAHCVSCLYAFPPGPWFAIEAYLRRQKIWSISTFGHGVRTVEITKHIQKELVEILAKPHDLTEWIDVVILALDGYWRHGGQVDAIMEYLQAKQNVNFTRTWLEPVAGEPTEHDRAEEIRRQIAAPGLPAMPSPTAAAIENRRYCKRAGPGFIPGPATACECLEGNCLIARDQMPI